MNIGISCYPTYGGSGVVATELGLKLADRGHQVHFVSYAMPFRFDAFRPNVFFHEVEVPSYPLFEYPPYSLALASTMAETAVRQKLDLIHCHYALPHATSAYLAKQMIDRPLPVVTTLHGTDITLVGNDPSFLPITRFSIAKSDAVTAVSDYLKDHTIRDLEVDTPIEVVPNFVDSEEFKRSKQTACVSAMNRGDEKIVMHVSNFRPVKRILDVIEVFAKIHEVLKARLVLVGDGPERSAAETACRRLGVSDDVLFLGKQSSLPALLSCADLFLLTSDAESFGLAALEAMSCGVPVVGARAGGLPEVVDHGGSGFLEPVGDVKAMAAGAIRILSDSSLQNEMSDNARNRAVLMFHPDKVVDQYEAIYNKVVSVS